MPEVLANPRVAVAAIIGATLIVVSVIGGLVLLAIRGADAGTIMSFVSLIVSVVIALRVEAGNGKMNAVQAQTNGTQSKLIDAAIAANAGTQPEGTHQ